VTQQSADPSGIRIERHLTDADLVATLRTDVAAGLTAAEPYTSPKYLYDARGSELFEQITELPEYYPTRREREILHDRAGEIAELSGADTVVELGSGSSTKTRLVLDALTAHGTLSDYVAVDVSESALVGAAQALGADYPGLAVHPVVADLERHLHLLPRGKRTLALFLGGTIGNLLPAERAAFLAGVHGWLAPGDFLLMGTDLVKDTGRLVAAYDDAAGVTAAFDLNLLSVLENQLGAKLDADAFAHRSVWVPEQEWIEMRLVAQRDTAIEVPELDVRTELAAGEHLRTEVSAKFRRERVDAELEAAGFDLAGWWTDAAGDFAVSLARVAD